MSTFVVTHHGLTLNLAFSLSATTLPFLPFQMNVPSPKAIQIGRGRLHRVRADDSLLLAPPKTLPRGRGMILVAPEEHPVLSNFDMNDT